MKYGPQDLWHHVKCFIEKREELEMFESIETVSGFETLSAEDKATLLKKIPALAKWGDERNNVRILILRNIFTID